MKKILYFMKNNINKKTKIIAITYSNYIYKRQLESNYSSF